MTTRRLAAILAADVVGFSKLIGENEAGTLAALREVRKEIVNPVLAEHGGRVFKLMGDGMLAEFPSAVQALRAAIEIQGRMRARNDGHPEGQQIEVRIGVHQGDVVIEVSDLLGDGVNIAARLEALAKPGGICISSRVHEDAAGKIVLQAKDMGEQNLKNIARPVRAYRISPSSEHAMPKAAADNPTLPLPDKPSIAVLPFQNMSVDPEQEYFADGIVEDIITALSRVRTFFVIARNSSFTYKGKPVDLKQVGRELGVRYVLEGSVRKAGARVRVTCQAIEAGTNHHIWADRFEGLLEDIFDLQDRITESVVGAIVPNLQLAEIERAQQKPTENLAAYDLYLRALSHKYTMTKGGLDESLRLLYRAIELEPSYALAKAMAAHCYVLRRVQLWSNEDERVEGVRLAREALSAHRDDPTTLAFGAGSLGYLAKEFENARNAIDRSLFLNPNSFLALTVKGLVENWMNKSDAAVDAFCRALRLSPLDPEKHWTLFGLANAYARLGRYEDGLEIGLAAIREKPEMSTAYTPVIRSLIGLNRIAEARDVVADLLRIDPTFTIRGYLDTSVSQGDAWRKEFTEAFRAAGLPE